MAENLEPLKPKDLGINDVEFYEVEQSPPVGFLGSMKGSGSPSRPCLKSL